MEQIMVISQNWTDNTDMENG